MKFMRFLGVLAFMFPCISFAAGTTDFQSAAKLLAAARRGDVQMVRTLVNSGVNVDYVDATGLSLVCTAVMNNDTRAIQILQTYGADASECDKQIKEYKQKTKVAASGEEYGFFSGLSSTHILALSAVGVAGVIGGVVLLSKAFDDDSGHGSGGSSGDRPNNNNGESSTTTANSLFAQKLPYGPACSGTTCPNDYSYWDTTNAEDFAYMSNNGFNYLMVARAYDSFVRGYLGAATVRNDTTKEVFDLSKYPFQQDVVGGRPINVAMVTETGVNATGSAADDFIDWFDEDYKNKLITYCSGDNTASCQEYVDASVRSSHKYYNYSGATAGGDENTSFNLTGGESVFGSSASDSDTKSAKIIAGWKDNSGDFYGFVPNGQLTVYKIGTGVADVSDYKNYAAIYSAAMLKDSNNNYVSNVIANLSLPSVSSSLDYKTVIDAKILNDAASNDTLKRSVYKGLINSYYDLNTTDNDTVAQPGMDAESAFIALGNYQNQILVNPAGRNLYGADAGQSLSPQDAVFENFAPAVYTDLQNLFMTVVAVKPTDGTGGISSISGYNPSAVGKLELATWSNGDINYSSRVCGLTGTGNGGAINPWCFAAPGATDMEATAAMAGSVALVKSAFNYMTPKEIFLLLALTADGPYLGTNPETGVGWTSTGDLITYLRDMYNLPVNQSDDDQYLESFKNTFGYGMINLERATRPGTNIYYYGSDKYSLVSSSGTSYWRSASMSSFASRSSNVLSLTNRGAIKTSFFDVIESADGNISLPRVWNATVMTENSKRGLYMGDVLGEFSVDSTNWHTNKIDDITFDIAVSPRAYNDNLNGLDNLRIGFQNEKYDLNAQYQRYLTDGESRFNGRANGVLALVANSVSSDMKYKIGNFAFGARAFYGNITDENLLENDPAISSQFEPKRLGFANGASVDTGYDNGRFGLKISFGNMRETNTLLGTQSDGLLAINGGDTQYIDAVAVYSMFDNVKLSARATFANTDANLSGGIISDLSKIKSNAFACGLDVGRFDFTFALPLAVVDGKMGYDYADLNVVENNGEYTVVAMNPHVEYLNLAPMKRELRFNTSYKHSIGKWTDAGVGFIYRVNPNNTDVFGNESLFMFKLHHRLGI